MLRPLPSLHFPLHRDGPLCQNPFGLIPSFTGVFRGKLLYTLRDCEIFMTLEQVETLVENCLKHNSLRKPHRLFSGEPPALLWGFISPHMGPGRYPREEKNGFSRPIHSTTTKRTTAKMCEKKPGYNFKDSLKAC